MADKLGPTFGDELMAAGLTGLQFTWMPSTGQIFGRENLTMAQRSTLDGVIAAHDPTKQRPKPPASCSKLQAMIALQRTNKLAAVEAAVATDPESKIWYEHSQVWHRDNPRIKALAPAVGLTEADLDDLFTLAQSITE